MYAKQKWHSLLSQKIQIRMTQNEKILHADLPFAEISQLISVILTNKIHPKS